MSFRPGKTPVPIFGQGDRTLHGEYRSPTLRFDRRIQETLGFEPIPYFWIQTSREIIQFFFLRLFKPPNDCEILYIHPNPYSSTFTHISRFLETSSVWFDTTKIAAFWRVSTVPVTVDTRQIWHVSPVTRVKVYSRKEWTRVLKTRVHLDTCI